MPIAAVPKYLGRDFSGASPGLRFGLYLPIWTDRADQEQEVRKRAEARSPQGQEIAAMLQSEGMDRTIVTLCQQQPRPLPGLWDKNDFAGRAAWEKVAALTSHDKRRMQALAERQSALAQPLVDSGGLLTVEARAIAPFTTGLGNEHPLENGFAFLNPYGLPYLPGSGVKGVVRQAAREVASGEWGDTQGWNAAALDALFGTEAKDGTGHRRGALIFWDVIPQIAGNSLMVEVMTAHQTHYYQNGQSPHESGSPKPINFLTVPPGSGFTFHVQCDRPFLARLAPALAEGDRWQSLLRAAFAHAFAWLGFGAKTAVGYGAMAEGRAAVSSGNGRDASAGGKPVGSVPMPAQVRWDSARLKFNRANGALTAEFQGKQAHAVAPDGERLLTGLPKSVQERIRRNEFVKAVVLVEGSRLTEVKEKG